MTALPELCTISPEPRQEQSALFLQQLDRTLLHGARLVQLRSKDLGISSYLELAQQAWARCRASGAWLILNHPSIVDFDDIPGDGIHLTSAALMAGFVRRSGHRLVAGACHGADELAMAERCGLDFVTLSPVLATPSHPGAAGIGWTTFAALASTARVKVFALGGVAPGDLAFARARGAYGVAGITSFWADHG